MKNVLLAVLLLSVTTAFGQNYALTLNGTNQAVSIGSPISSGSSYTKEAWVFLTTTANSRNIISSTNTPFWIDNGFLFAGQAGSYKLVSDPSAFPANIWVHVAVTYDASANTMRLYRDGTLVSTNTSVPAYTSEATYIGSHTGALSFLQGRVDEVRIWNTVRTQAQIKETMYAVPVSAPGLIAYYPCNDGSGSTLTDAKGSFSGTIQNAAGFVASPVQSAASALAFDGVNDVVVIPDNNNLDITSAITLEAWVYPTKNTGIQDVISKSSNSINTGYIFPRTDNGWTNFSFYLCFVGGWKIVNAPFPSLNSWHHLAATYDGAMMRLYLDGVLVNSVAQTGAITTNTNVLALGNQPGFFENFGGYADEFRVWNVARSQAQIQANMNRQLSTNDRTGLVSYYSVNMGVVGGNNAGLTTLVDHANTNNGQLANFSLTGTISNFVGQNSVIALPVQWSSFTAIKSQNRALLQWTTINEENSKEFVLQKSGDAVNWQTVESIPAAGYSNVARNYSIEDPRPFAGNNYYRILQSDMDGKIAYSDIKLLQFSAATSKPFTLLSNPVPQKQLQLRVHAPVQVAVYDGGGKRIWQQQAAPGPLTIDLSAKPAGVYVVRAGDQSEQVLLK